MCDSADSGLVEGRFGALLNVVMSQSVPWPDPLMILVNQEGEALKSFHESETQQAEAR